MDMNACVATVELHFQIQGYEYETSEFNGEVIFRLQNRRSQMVKLVLSADAEPEESVIGDGHPNPLHRRSIMQVCKFVVNTTDPTSALAGVDEIMAA